MVFACVAIIDQNNAPLYVKHIGESDDLKFSYLVHTSLDIINEKADSPEMYLGLLAPAEEYNMCEPIALLSNNHFKQTRDRFFTHCCSYGYLTNTKVKLVAVLDDPDAGIKMKNFFRKLHGLYIDQVCSPFYIINTAIESKRFDAAVTSLVNSF